MKVSKVLGLNEDIKDRLLKALLILLVACATMDDVKAATGKEMDLNSPEVPKRAGVQWATGLSFAWLGSDGHLQAHWRSRHGSDQKKCCR